MRDDLEQKLAEAYPFMRRQRMLAEQTAQGYVYDLYGAFGCACGDGWYDLLNKLCAEITEAYRQVGLPADIVVDQVKEKYGTLRFYHHFEEQAHDPQRVDLPACSDGCRKEQDRAIHSVVDSIVEKWEVQSETVCETCGEQGETRTDLSWILTLCDHCYAKYKQRSQG